MGFSALQFGGVLSIRRKTSSSSFPSSDFVGFAMVDMTAYAYELIGRAVFAWGHFEQYMVSHIWMSRKPVTAFYAGPLEQGFSKRWNEWCRIHRPYAEDRADFEKFHRHVQNLSDFRDDLSHNIHDISYNHYGTDFGLHVFRVTPDWRTKFDRWKTKYGHLPWKARPPAPYTKELLHYRKADVVKFISETEAALEKIKTAALQSDVKSSQSIRVAGCEPSASVVPKYVVGYFP